MTRPVYCLLLMAAMITSSGCATVNGTANGAVAGASSGFRQDAQSITDPDRNGWGILGQWDAWVQQHLW
jgi:uncharacterized protein YceK